LKNLITIDGPSGVGKGTLAIALAEKLQWHYLNSGSLYRIIAYLSEKNNIDISDKTTLVNLVKNLEIRFEIDNRCLKVIHNNNDIYKLLQSEDCAKRASEIALVKELRMALIKIQRSFYKNPGLIAEGRDMGSVIFIEAELKFFLRASALIRSERRHKQLKQKGINVSLTQLIHKLDQRDERDSTRNISPLVIPKGAVVINTDGLNIDEVFDKASRSINKILKIKI
jgi:cytidylate kinase